MTEYKDMKNNTYKLLQTVIMDDRKKIYTKEEIMEELYKIFTKNKRK